MYVKYAYKKPLSKVVKTTKVEVVKPK
jgi:hypothetical protein